MHKISSRREKKQNNNNVRGVLESSAQFFSNQSIYLSNSSPVMSNTSFSSTSTSRSFPPPPSLLGVTFSLRSPRRSALPVRKYPSHAFHFSPTAAGSAADLGVRFTPSRPYNSFVDMIKRAIKRTSGQLVTRLRCLRPFHMNGRDIRFARRLKPWYTSTLALYRIRISLSHSSRKIFLEEGGGK